MPVPLVVETGARRQFTLVALVPPIILEAQLSVKAHRRSSTSGFVCPIRARGPMMDRSRLVAANPLGWIHLGRILGKCSHYGDF